MSSARPSPKQSASSARHRSLSVLLAFQKSGDAIDEILDRLWTGEAGDARDRAFAMELIYGVLRRQETLDWRLAPVLSKPLARLPQVIQVVLRLGAYQLLYMDRVPESAAVNESVNLARSHAAKLGRDWGGLVNAVLRALMRSPEPPLPDGQHMPARGLSVRYALPLWLCERWVQRLGVEGAETACKTVSVIPSLTLRVNRQRATREGLLEQFQKAGIVSRPTTVSPAGIVVEGGQSVTALPGFHEGLFYVEDEAAQLIPLVLDPQPGERILDACAAPGGKTTHIADLMSNRGEVVAMDRQPSRLKLLAENCRRLGATIIAPLVGDARELGSPTSPKSTDQRIIAPGLFDRILVDAPCSGIGVLRRHPDAKWKKDTGMFARHQILQRAILDRAASVLRPGGVLVYSTCSTEPEETEEVIGRFCRDHSAFRRESVATWLSTAVLPFVTPQGSLSTLGNELGMDGFYAARLRKAEHE